VAVFLAFACFALAYTWGGRIVTPPVRHRAAVDGATANERVLIYFGASTCRPSQDPALAADVRAIRRALRESRRLVAIGVAVDNDVQAGLAHLSSVDAFDEVLSGHGWANEGVLKYIAGDLGGPAATPQIVVVDRHITNEGDSGELGSDHETVRVRKVGLVAIRRWRADGARIDP
jgi:hypothetical protein